MYNDHPDTLYGPGLAYHGDALCNRSQCLRRIWSRQKISGQNAIASNISVYCVLTPFSGVAMVLLRKTLSIRSQRISRQILLSIETEQN